jgi:hypothetical protein
MDAQQSEDTQQSEKWILQTQELLSKAYEARDFIERAAENFRTAVPTHAIAIARLWQRAESLDQLIAGHLITMNNQLFEGKGEVDTTRGASTRSLLVGEELLMYDCTWTLSWDRNTRGIIVKFSIEPEMESLHLRVENLTVAGGQDIRYPLYEDQLADALAKAYVLEILD